MKDIMIQFSRAMVSFVNRENGKSATIMGGMTRSLRDPMLQELANRLEVTTEECLESIGWLDAFIRPERIYEGDKGQDYVHDGR
jgi:hypothetical protein